MAVYIKVPVVYRKQAGGKSIIESKPGTIKDALRGLVEEYPDLKKKIFEKDGVLKHQVNLYINQKSIKNLDYCLKDNDELLMLTAIAGG